MTVNLKGKELERFNIVKERLSKIEKAIPGTKFFNLVENTGLEIQRSSSGSFKMDKILGGGLPNGRIIELYGEPSSGKTTISLTWAAEYTKNKKFVLFIDAEQAFDPIYAKKLGVDLDYFTLIQPDYGEQAFEVLKASLMSGVFSYIVVDSVAALTPKAELEKDLESESKIGSLAKLMSRGLATVVKTASNSKTTITFINQTRVKIGGFSPFGTPKDTTGGVALKFYSSIRVDVRKADDIKRKDTKIGQFVKVRTIKNKTFAPFKEELIKIQLDEEKNEWGIDSWEEIFDEIISRDILGQRGSYLTLRGIKVRSEGGLPGKDVLKEYLKENPDEFDFLAKKIKDGDLEELERDSENKVIGFTPSKKEIVEEKTENSEENLENIDNENNNENNENQENNTEELSKEEIKELDDKLVKIIKEAIGNGEDLKMKDVLVMGEQIQKRKLSNFKITKLLKLARG